jgi:uncharacterized membrane protein (UPF0127 family)
VTAYLRVRNRSRETVLGERIVRADRWWQRLRGLLGAPPPQPGEGLLLTPCRAVHMVGMRAPLDVAFVDGDGHVVAVYPALRPGARTGWHADARHALELPAGTLERGGTRAGDLLEWGVAPRAAMRSDGADAAEGGRTPRR